MSQTPPSTPEAITQALADADAALDRLDWALGQLEDKDLHRGHFDGGWTPAQVISHINMCAILWLGDIKRLECDPELDFVFREEVGHDLVGFPPPTLDEARRQLASTRRTLATAGGVVTPEVLARTVTIPDLGTLTVEQWCPPIIGHAAGHVEQALEVMRNRGFLPEGI